MANNCFFGLCTRFLRYSFPPFLVRIATNNDIPFFWRQGENLSNRSLPKRSQWAGKLKVPFKPLQKLDAWNPRAVICDILSTSHNLQLFLSSQLRHTHTHKTLQRLKRFQKEFIHTKKKESRTFPQKRESFSIIATVWYYHDFNFR